MTDAQGGIQTIVMEILAFNRTSIVCEGIPETVPRVGRVVVDWALHQHRPRAAEVASETEA
jgi:hypothetical protein